MINNSPAYALCLSDCGVCAARFIFQEDCLGITCFYARVKGRSVTRCPRPFFF